ncbi:MAG TPA: PKD domain-containing protein [Bacteroidia bacterium]|nr:PKD domain-containing protein [Bacteroidia bacterium]
MSKRFFLILFYFIFSFVETTNAQVSGCTDPQANNYNASATVNNGSCTYNTTNLALTDKTALSTPLLDENSGIEFVDGKLWTHNDSGNSNDIFRVDTASSTVFQTVEISNATNTDWEDMTSSKDYLFVGDMGNNNGNRQDLKIYRIDKTDLTAGATSVTADIINFSYSDQASFPSLPNNNNFDCESIIFFNDSIHLFSKNWVDKQSKHYVLPNIPGTHVAQLRETLNAGYLVTSATVQKGGVIALLGYDNGGVAPIYIYMLYDYKNNLFFNGNKRRFNVANALSHGQTEGVEFFSGAYGYVSNERFNNIVNIPPKLKTFNLAPYLPNAFIYPKPDAAFASTITSVCKNATVTFTDQSDNDPASWQWSFPGGTPSTSTLQNPVIQYLTVGTYSVTLIASNATGTDTIVKTNYISVNALPSANISAGGPLNFCMGGSVLLSVNTGAGLTYQWKKGANNISGATSSTYTATSTGNYKVVVTNQSGCSRTSAVLSVTGPPSIAITITGSLDLCPGDSVTFQVPVAAGNLYQWKKNNVNIAGGTSNKHVVYTAGNYKVNVTNSFGCSKLSAKKTVTTNCRMVADAFNNSDEIKIYPNPATEYFTVQLNNNNSYRIMLFDLSGKEIESHAVSSARNFVFGENLLPGFYLCHIYFGNESKVFKVVKSGD